MAFAPGDKAKAPLVPLLHRFCQKHASLNILYIHLCSDLLAVTSRENVSST